MRKLAWFALSYAAAVFLAVYLLPEEKLLPAGVLCALAGAGGVALRGDRRLRWVLLCFGLGAGLLWTGLYTALFHAPARLVADSEHTVTAQVEQWPEADSRWVTVRFQLEEGPVFRAVMWMREVPEDLRPGDIIQGKVRLELADTLGGDSSDYYHSRGVTLYAYLNSEAEVSRPERLPVRYWPAWGIHAMQQSALAVFPEGTGALVNALLTGDTSGLEDGVLFALRRTGTAHVVAVSGLHVSFLAGLAGVLIRRRRLAAVVSIGLMFCFAAAVGNTPSVLRAAFMHSMLLLAPLLDREDDRITSLSIILMAQLVQNPYAAASISLQLSFGAVAGIYLFTGPLCRCWQRGLPSRPRGFWRQLGCQTVRFLTASLATTLGAIALTTPLSAAYFGTLSLISPLANLLVLWSVSILFLGGLGVAALGLLLPGAAELLALPVSLAGTYLTKTVSALSSLPLAAVSTDSIYIRSWLVLVYAITLVCLLLRARRARLVLPIFLCGATLLWALLLNAFTYTRGLINMTVLDVGQGLSAVVYSKGASALVDCGGSGMDNAGDTAADFFQDLCLRRIDVVILTHYHSDHANGMERLLDRMDVGLLVLPDVEPEDPLRQTILAAAEEKGVEILTLREITRLSLGEAELTVYPPLGTGDANEEGLSVLCTAGEFDALITGDMDQETERRLLQTEKLPHLDLLVVGHHGAKDATSEELLLATEPKMAVISVGYNSYGHPAQETLERLVAAGCDVYRTDWSGKVTVSSE